MHRRPLTLFRFFAVAEAITWTLLLLGMVLKYGSRTTDLGVRVFGMTHGVVFIAYCLVTLFVATNQRWSAKHLGLGLLAAIPPLATIAFDRMAERAGLLDGGWRLAPGGDRPATPPERAVAWSLARPGAAALSFVVAVAVLTGVALLVGPPAANS